MDTLSFRKIYRKQISTGDELNDEGMFDEYS